MTSFATVRILLCVCLSLLWCGSTAHAENIEISGRTMGTYFRVVVDSPPDDFDPQAFRSRITARLEAINAQMSTWEQESEISRFNADDSTEWFEVSPEFASVTAEAKRIFELTEGAFDPTVAPLIQLWGFGDRRKKTIPRETDIATAKSLTGMQHLDVRLKPPALRKSIPRLQLNLSAIAKGYAVDQIAVLLKANDLPAFVVDIGGENRAGAKKSSGQRWKLGIESPLGKLTRVVPLTNQAIATSGDYRNKFTVDGVTYSHAIDPATGWPVRNPPASVSVIADSCMTADAWATALMVLGVEKGIEVAKAQGLSVLLQEVMSETEISQHGTGILSAAPDLPESESTGEAAWFPFVAAAVIFLIAVAGMAIGTILQNKSLKGSCGGLASMPGSEGKSICELCTIPKEECTNAELREQMQAAAEHSSPSA